MQTNEKIVITKEQVLETAERMRSEGRLLVMIHGYLEQDGAAVVTYDYDDGANLFSYEVRGESVLPSIAGIYDQAAAWPEREINELLPISFEGLNCEQRLFLPDNLLDGKGQILVTPLNELREKNGL